MRVDFRSLDSDNNEITYQSEAEIKNNTLIFNDNELDDTKIYFKLKDDSIDLRRVGLVNMKLILDKNNKSYLTYKQENLYMELDAKLIFYKKNGNSIYFEYNLYDGNNYLGNHKIWINLH